jgi:hypothetical protein
MLWVCPELFYFRIRKPIRSSKWLFVVICCFVSEKSRLVYPSIVLLYDVGMDPTTRFGLFLPFALDVQAAVSISTPPPMAQSSSSIKLIKKSSAPSPEGNISSCTTFKCGGKNEFLRL